MSFTLPKLPYAMDALIPYISQETLEYHYQKHHNAYVVNLNKLLEGSDELLGKTLEEVILLSYNNPNRVGIFNNAAQIWNHTFYWNCLSPNGGGEPTGKLLEAIDKAFGSFAAFKEQFTQAAISTFGSGWAWLVLDHGKLAIISTANQDSPLMEGKKPLLGLDVWNSI